MNRIYAANQGFAKESLVELSTTTMLEVWVVTYTQSLSNTTLAKQNVLNCNYPTIVDLLSK